MGLLGFQKRGVGRMRMGWMSFALVCAVLGRMESSGLEVVAVVVDPCVEKAGMVVVAVGRPRRRLVVEMAGSSVELVAGLDMR